MFISIWLHHFQLTLLVGLTFHPHQFVSFRKGFFVHFPDSTEWKKDVPPLRWFLSPSWICFFLKNTSNKRSPEHKAIYFVDNWLVLNPKPLAHLLLVVIYSGKWPTFTPLLITKYQLLVDNMLYHDVCRRILCHFHCANLSLLKMMNSMVFFQPSTKKLRFRMSNPFQGANQQETLNQGPFLSTPR